VTRRTLSTVPSTGTIDLLHAKHVDPARPSHRLRLSPPVSRSISARRRRYAPSICVAHSDLTVYRHDRTTACGRSGNDLQHSSHAARSGRVASSDTVGELFIRRSRTTAGVRTASKGVEWPGQRGHQVTALFVVLGLASWLGARRVTDSQLVQLVVLFGVGVVVPTSSTSGESDETWLSPSTPLISADSGVLTRGLGNVSECSYPTVSPVDGSPTCVRRGDDVSRM